MPQINRFNVRLEHFAVYTKAFTPEEVEQIVFLENLQNFEKGSVGGEGVNSRVELESRNSDISWIHQDSNSQWIFDRFSYCVSTVNHHHFMYDIDGYDAFQYTKYGEGQYYNWHLDVHFDYLNWERKISAVIMLSDPDEYRGGELEIIANGNPEKSLKLKPEKGDIVFFASWMPHRVVPVISGVRKTLVCWVMGKRNG